MYVHLDGGDACAQAERRASTICMFVVIEVTCVLSRTVARKTLSVRTTAVMSSGEQGVGLNSSQATPEGETSPEGGNRKSPGGRGKSWEGGRKVPG